MKSGTGDIFLHRGAKPGNWATKIRHKEKSGNDPEELAERVA